MASDDHARRVAEFDRLYGEHGLDVLAYCRRRASPETADDALAETFLIAWRRLEEMPANPRAWLLGVARRVLANQRRSARRQGALVERLTAVPPSRNETAAADDPVLEALAMLPELEREALMLIAWDGLTSSEAAEVLGCTAVAVRLRVFRARRRLARLLTTTVRAPRIRLNPEEET